MKFSYLIYQEANNVWRVRFTCSEQNFVSNVKFKSYLDVLRAVRLLQLPITKFDLETLRLADSLNLPDAA